VLTPKETKKRQTGLMYGGFSGKVMDSHMEPLEERLNCWYCYGFVSFWRKERGGSLQ